MRVITKNNEVRTIGVYASLPGGQDFRIFSTKSSAISATNEGLRSTMWQFFDNKADDIDTAVLVVDQIQRTNPGNGTIKKTGIHVKHYSQPDNGGDASGGLFVETGGGSALTAYKVSATHRPGGYTDYSDSPQGALEAATSDKSQAGLFISGVYGTSNISNAIYARIDNTSSKGILVSPGNGVFDSRVAFAVGSQVIGAADVNVTFSIGLDGRTKISDGTLAAPSLSFVSDTDSGFYHAVGANQINVSLGGYLSALFATTAVKIARDDDDQYDSMQLVWLRRHTSGGAVANNDVLGDFAFNAQLGAGETQVGLLRASIPDASASYDTQFDFYTSLNGVLGIIMTLTGGGVGILTSPGYPIDVLGNARLGAASGAAGSRIIGRGEHTSAPAGTLAVGEWEMACYDNAVAPVIRFRYNDGGSVKTIDVGPLV